MNFLAHTLLSGPSPEVAVGNLTADFIKGRVRRTLPAGLQAGFALHHRIDSFTDTHASVAQAAELIAPRWGRYAPILIDVYFDHLLAADFAAYHADPLDRYAAAVYDLLRRHHHLLPERAQYAADHMIRQDWLTSYATRDGIALAFARMSGRLRHDIDLAPAIDDLAACHTAIAAHFAVFWPGLKHAADMYRRELDSEPRRHGGTEDARS
jgi:acyl carrier protein phosphodiesterase